MSDQPSIALQVPFTLETEQHDRETFQKEGHFVAGLTDENGRRRPWEGGTVYKLTLKYKGEQVLHVMSDSPEDAAKLMTMAIQDTFFALWTAQFVKGFNYEAWMNLNKRRNDMQEFIEENYKREIQAGEHGRDGDVFETAIRYMRKERQGTGITVADILKGRPK